jgi:hypothetical protein
MPEWPKRQRITQVSVIGTSANREDRQAYNQPTMERETLRPTRERIGNEWHSVHVTADGLVRVDMGPDDQRPAHDGCMFWRPICVAESMSFGDGVWQYHYYCGHCHKRMGALHEVKEFCPRCGAGVAHYIFAMGYERHKHLRESVLDDPMPDSWPPT